jgi:3'-5' exoribonuclease
MNGLEQELAPNIGKRITASYLVGDGELRQAVSGNPYWSGSFISSKGTVKGSVFDEAISVSENVGKICTAVFAVKSYQGNILVDIKSTPVYEELTDANAGAFIRTSYLPRKKAEEFFGSINADLPPLLGLACDHFLSDPLFWTCPAAVKHHQNYRGGLYEHTYEVVRVVQMAAEFFPVSADLAVAGAILHDVGKISEYEMVSPGVYRRTLWGDSIGHIAGGAIRVADYLKSRTTDDASRATAEALVHIILSHHGQRDWGSPVTPQTPEAHIVHNADRLCAHTAESLSEI